MLKANKQRTRSQAFARSLLAALMLLSYLGANTSFDVVHAFLHDDAIAVTHTSQDELDPCHRNLYHHDNVKGCEHKSHVSKSHHCSLCHFATSPDKIVARKSEITFKSEGHAPFGFLTLILDEQSLFYFSSRGPPSC